MKHKILLIESNEGHIEHIYHAFSIFPNLYELKISATLSEAKSIAIEYRPDFILASQECPDGDVTELLPILRNGQVPPPLIILADTHSESESVQARKNGAMEYLVKSPETFQELPRTVERVLREFSLLTEHQRMVDALARSEKRYRHLFESMTEGVALNRIILNENEKPVDYEIIEVNPAFESITGITKKKAEGTLASKLYGPFFKMNLGTYATVAKSGNPEAFEGYFAPLKRNLHFSIFSPEPGYFATLMNDVTDSKRTLEAYQREHNFTKSIIDSSLEGLLVFDMRCHILIWNSGMEKLSGLKKEKMLGRQIFTALPTLKEKGLQDKFQVALRGEKLEVNDLQLRFVREGEALWVNAQFSPISGEMGKTLAGLAVFSDITAQKRAEHELKEIQLLHQKLINRKQMFMFRIDPQGTIVHLNPALTEVLRKNEASPVGEHWLEQFVPKTYVDNVSSQFQNIYQSGKSACLIYPIQLADGSQKVYEWHTQLIKDDTNAAVGLLGLGMNISNDSQKRPVQPNT